MLDVPSAQTLGLAPQPGGHPLSGQQGAADARTLWCAGRGVPQLPGPAEIRGQGGWWGEPGGCVSGARPG